MTRVSPLVVLAVVVLASCDTLDSPPLLEPDANLPSITDGRDLGSGVFLLPPINDNDYTRAGAFDIDADPRVEICRLDVAGTLTESSVEAAECVDGPPEYWFETDAAHDGETFINVTPAPGGGAADSMFSVGWKTNSADADVAFRGTVRVPSLTLDGTSISVEYLEAARFDVVLYDNASTKLDPDRVVGFNAGQNFPIKFIVEENAGCDGLDCFAYKVTCETDVYQTEHAGVLMPEDWATECDVTVPGPERSWWLFQERLPEASPCLPGSLIDGIPFEPCYVWQLVEEVDGQGDASTFAPYVAEFAIPATIQFCNNPVEDGGVPEALESLAGVFRYSVPPGEVALVPGAEENALTEFTCPYDGPAVPSGFLGLDAFTDGVVRPALELMGLAPRPLYAGDTGTLSAKTIRMSHFQRLLQLVLTASDDLTPAVILGGSTELGVQLTSPPHHDPLDGPSAGVPGVEVQFQVVSGDADDATLSGAGAQPCPGVTDGTCVLVTTSGNLESTTTDEGGFATATVTVGSTPGPVEIAVTVPADPDFAGLSYTIDAVDLMVAFLEPLEAGDFYGAPDERFEPTVLICAQGSTPCTESSAEAVIPTSAIKLVEENGRKFYQTDWKPRDTGTSVGGTYLVQVEAEGITVGYSIPIIVTKGGKGERVGDVYYNGVNSSLPLKFTITRVSP